MTGLKNPYYTKKIYVEPSSFRNVPGEKSDDDDFPIRRFPSPPPSLHSSLENLPLTEENESLRKPDVANRKKYEKKRTAHVSAFFIALEKCGGSFAELFKYHDDPNEQACYDDPSLDDVICTSSQRERCLKQLVETEKKMRSMEAKTTPFDYTQAPWLMKLKWLHFRLRRMRRILGGELLDARIAPEWLDASTHLQNWYGPIDETSEKFKQMEFDFKAARYEDLIEMIEAEDKVIALMNKYQVFPSSGAVQTVARHVEAKIDTITEVLKYCPQYNKIAQKQLSTVGTDFYHIPRKPSNTPDVYRIRTREMDNLMEYKLEMEKNPEIESRYNVSLYDVACEQFFFRVTTDMPTDSYFTFTIIQDGRKLPHPLIRNWDQYLLEFRNLLLEYPFGVEFHVFTSEFRKRNKIRDETTIFGALTDQKGLEKLSDIFFPQNLGKWVICYTALLEGLIITPKKIMDRTWQQIRTMVEIGGKLNISKLPELYEQMYGLPLCFQFWGANSLDTWVEKIMKNFSEDAEDLEIVECEDDDGKMQKWLVFKNNEEKEVEDPWKDFNLEDDSGGDENSIPDELFCQTWQTTEEP